MYNAPLSLKGLDVFLVLTQHSSTCHVIHLLEPWPHTN